MTNGQQPNEGITAISVSGFKSLYDESRIEIRPLTILAGANSSGKSSIMQPLLLLKQTLEAPYDPGPLMLRGPLIQFDSMDELLPVKGGGRATDRLIVALEEGDAQSLVVTFAKAKSRPVEITETILRFGSTLIALHPNMSAEEIRNDLTQVYPQQPWQGWVLQVVPQRCFLTVGFSVKGSAIQDVLGLTAPFQAQLRDLLHVPASRIVQEEAFPTSSVVSGYPGNFVNYVPSIVNTWKLMSHHNLESLAAAMQGLGLTWTVEPRQISDTRVQLLVGRLPARGRGAASDLVKIHQVGSGVSRVLPVLVALLVARAGELVYLEEPEMHLHPKAQTALAQVLADAAKRGVRVVAETHSSLLLLGIQSLVAEGRLSPDLVKLHWFSRGKDGATKIKPGELDGAGRFGDWPEDFGDVDLEAQSRYLNAVGLFRSRH